MFAIVCWFSSICVTSFCRTISSDLPKHCKFVSSFKPRRTAAVRVDHLSTVMASLACLGNRRAVSIEFFFFFIMNNSCCFSSTSKTSALTVSQYLHRFPCFVENYPCSLKPCVWQDFFLLCGSG